MTTPSLAARCDPALSLAPHPTFAAGKLIFTDGDSLHLSHISSTDHTAAGVTGGQQHTTSSHKRSRVGIIGGGTAGSTIAIRLAELGVETYLFEQNASLIDGPPMCHLHAGGNLYRELSDEDCVALLKQCIDILRLYPYTIDVRPTVFAVPTRDPGSPNDLIPRLKILTKAYRDLIRHDPNNKVLGDPKDYYQLYERSELDALAQRPQVKVPKTIDEWMIPVAKYLDLDKVKYPLIVVQEYGWNIFRLAASATLALSDRPHAHVLTNTTVKQVTALSSQANPTGKPSCPPKWQIDFERQTISDASESPLRDSGSIEVDYLINACGFRTGVIDDMAGVSSERMVEFKSSYVTHWSASGGQIPEIIIHGERGTPHGMAQLTPYPDGYFQIHGMSKQITLFKDGLVTSSAHSAQPDLPNKYMEYIEEGWDPFALKTRSQRAIDFVSQFVPSFKSAITIGNALYGGQQIPGDDDSLRVADISLYNDKHYARAENVKASSALLAADAVVSALQDLGLVQISAQHHQSRLEHHWQYLSSVDNDQVTQLAQVLADQRHFPKAMAKVNHSIIKQSK